MREIVLDTETTGLDPGQGHRLVEIGCIELVNRIPTGQTFHGYLNPERDMPAEAFAVHGLTVDFLKDKPLFRRDRRRVPRLPRRDAPLVDRTTRRSTSASSTPSSSASSGTLIARERLVDTLMLARRKHPGGRTGSTISARATASTTRAAPSTARCSTPRLLAEVYVELIGARQAMLGLADDDRAGGEAARRAIARARGRLR